MMLVLSLMLSLSPAHASVNAALVGTAQHLVASAQKDVAFLDQNVANCTRFAQNIKEKMIQPIAKDLQSFQMRLARYHDDAPGSCTSRADLDFIQGSIAMKLQAASTAQSELMGMTGDEAMTKALSADVGATSFPNCRAEDPKDPRTTPELRTYFALKLKLITLRANAIALKAKTDCEKRED